MKVRIFPLCLLIALPIFLSACFEKKPSKDDIKASLISELPAFAKIETFSVEAMQGVGTDIEPVWVSRFKAEIKLNTETFIKDGNEYEAFFVRSFKKEGDLVQFFGKSTSKLYAGKWVTSINFEGDPIDSLGIPLSSFPPSRIIVRGSSEEKEFYKEIEEKKKEREIRIQQELERRKAQDEIKLMAQREAESRKLEEKQKMFANAPKLIIGTWRSEDSVATFRDDSALEVKWDKGQSGEARWSMEGDLITMEFYFANGQQLDTALIQKAVIIEITDQKLVTKSMSDGSIMHSIRIK